MQLLEAFLPRLLPLVPGCPHPLALQELVDSAIEFCEKTQIVQLTTQAVNLVAGQQTYAIDLPGDTAVGQVLRAWYGNTELALVAQGDVDSPLAYNPIAGGSTRPSGTPSVALVIEPATLTLYPTPNASEIKALTVRIATKPTRSAQTLDDALYENWVEAIVFGAAYRIAAMPGQAYSSDTNALKYDTLYRRHIGAARIESSRGRVRGLLTIKMRPFA